MPNYFYNDVELPALPDVTKHNTTENSYDYAFISKNLVKGEISIFFSSKPVSKYYRPSPFNNYCLRTFPLEEVDYYCVYTLNESNEWEESAFILTANPQYLGEKVPLIVLTGIDDKEKYEIIWSNHDIVDKDNGGVYITGNDPVPITRYLYNGVELPALPEYDKTKYPYVYISRHESFGIWEYVAQFTSSPFYGYENGSGAYCIGFRAGDIAYYVWDGLTTQWGEETTWDRDGVLAKLNDSLIWANFDILNEDGSVYLAASYPTDAETGEEIHDYEILPSVEPYPYPDDPDAIAYIYGEHGIGPLLPLTSTIRENYPYAMIFNGHLIFTDHPVVVIPPRWWDLTWEVCTQENLTTKYIKYLQRTNDAGDLYFERFGQGTAEGVTWTRWWLAAPWGNVHSGLDYSLVIWSNYTVYDIGGGVVCKPSMPIPVYAESDIPDTPEPEPEPLPTVKYVSIYAENPEDWKTQDFYDNLDGKMIKRDTYVMINGEWLLVIDDGSEPAPVES